MRLSRRFFEFCLLTCLPIAWLRLHYFTWCLHDSSWLSCSYSSSLYAPGCKWLCWHGIYIYVVPALVANVIIYNSLDFDCGEPMPYSRLPEKNEWCWNDDADRQNSLTHILIDCTQQQNKAKYELSADTGIHRTLIIRHNIKWEISVHFKNNTYPWHLVIRQFCMKHNSFENGGCAGTNKTMRKSRKKNPNKFTHELTFEKDTC